MEIKSNQLLSELTTFRIGGPASFFAEVASMDELNQAMEFAKSKNLAVFVLGGGSNILVSDSGFDGLVIRNKMKGLTIQDSGGVIVGAGENWDDVVAAAGKKNLAGVECLSGVPGSAGGAVVQNIGAYGQTVGDLVTKVYAVDLATGEEKHFSADECQFVYRNSMFKKNPGKYIVTKFELRLNPSGSPMISYPQVKKHFEKISNPTLQQVREFIIQIRASKGYVIMEGFERFNTAGSFFKNPVVNDQLFEKLKPMFGDETLNRFWQMPNGVKLAAAFLLQEAGFEKGYREGNVGISPKHSLSLVNFGGGTANEVLELAKKIKSVVLEKFGVELEEEVLYV